MHNDKSWIIILHEDFEAEFSFYKESLQNEFLAHCKLLECFGPELGRPTVDTLKASNVKNMKELRLNYKTEVWRFLFAFDPNRQAIILAGGNKKGKNQKRFYRSLIKIADQRYANYLKEG